MIWIKGRVYPLQVCWWQNLEEWLIHQIALLPSGGTWTGWRNGLTETSWSSARENVKSCTEGGISPCVGIYWDYSINRKAPQPLFDSFHMTGSFWSMCCVTSIFTLCVCAVHLGMINSTFSYSCFTNILYFHYCDSKCETGHAKKITLCLLNKLKLPFDESVIYTVYLFLCQQNWDLEQHIIITIIDIMSWFITYLPHGILVRIQQ